MLNKFKTVTREDGFTLVEILVVILIIGILAAIAIPVFLNQRQTAVNASLESDVKQMVSAQMSWIASNPGGYGNMYGAQMAIREPTSTEPQGSHNSQGIVFKPSPGNYIKVPYITDAEVKPIGVCIIAWSPNSKKYPTEHNGLRWSSITGKFLEGTSCNGT